jgi:CIC family chloride channel protein
MADREATSASQPRSRDRALKAAVARLLPWGTRWRQPLRPSGLRESQLFLLLAVVIGLLAGCVVVCFRIAFEMARIWLLGSGLTPPWTRTLLIPPAVGLVVAVLVMCIFPEVRGSGVNQTKAAVYIFDGYVPFSTVIGKFLTCALALGGGFSLGPEDPSLQMGAGVASALGRRMRLSREKTRLLAPIGAAAGLAAAFNAPIAAVLFVVEEVIGTWSAGGLGALILAAVSGVVVLRLFLGSQPIFRIPPYPGSSPLDLLGYAAVGVFGGFASLIFLKFLVYVRPRLRRLPRWTFYLQPAAAGLLTGLIGLIHPEVMGAGYVYIDQVLHGEYAWNVLGELGGLKILATGLAFASGTPGGLFAPAMFIGAMLGGMVYGLAGLVTHRLAGSVSSFALVGIGTLFAGFLRTPITSVFMVVEVSGSYEIIVPVMIANTIAYLISRRYQRLPLFDLLSRQDGIELPSLEEQREQPILRVEDAMVAPEIPVVSSGSSLAEAASRAEAAGAGLVLVRFPGGHWVVASRDWLETELRSGDGSRSLAALLGPPWLPTVHPDQPLDSVLGHAQRFAVIPVVSRADRERLEGVITLEAVLDTYRRTRQPIRAQVKGHSG